MFVTSALEKLRQEHYCKVENILGKVVNSSQPGTYFKTNRKVGAMAQQVKAFAA